MCSHPIPTQQLDGLPLNILKQKAAVEANPNVPLGDWIHQARQMYAAAIEADSLNRMQSAYYHYFKSAGLVFSKHTLSPSPKFISSNFQERKIKSSSAPLQSVDSSNHISKI